MNMLRAFELACARIGLVAIVIIILVGGLGRAIGHPVIWSLEVAMVIFAWISMLAIDYAFQKRRHIGIDALTNLFSLRMQRACLWFNEILILLFLLRGVWYGFNFTWTTHHQALPVTEISLAWLNSAVPTGCLLMVFSSVSFLINGCQVESQQQDNQEELCS